MTNAPIIDEIHRVREKIWHECDGDLEKLLKRQRQVASRHQDRLVSIDEVRARRIASDASSP